MDATPLLEMNSIYVERDGVALVSDVCLTIQRNEFWVILGANGSGKSTLLDVAALRTHPSRGHVRVLGSQLGNVDIRPLKNRIGSMSASLLDQLRGSLTALEVVMCGKNAALEPWWHTYSAHDVDHAHQLLFQLGVEQHATQTLHQLSSGERTRVLLARALANNPELIVADEPSNGLDFVGREELVSSLNKLMANGRSTVMVCHHLEDIPPCATHVGLMKDSFLTCSGPIASILTESNLVDCFDTPMTLHVVDDRYVGFANRNGDC